MAGNMRRDTSAPHTGSGITVEQRPNNQHKAVIRMDPFSAFRDALEMLRRLDEPVNRAVILGQPVPQVGRVLHFSRQPAGGWLETTQGRSVECKGAKVGPGAIVYDGARVFEAELCGNVMVGGQGTLVRSSRSGRPRVDSPKSAGCDGGVQILDHAIISGGVSIRGNVTVEHHGKVRGRSALSCELGRITVKDYAELNSVRLGLPLTFGGSVHVTGNLMPDNVAITSEEELIRYVRQMLGAQHAPSHGEPAGEPLEGLGESAKQIAETPVIRHPTVAARFLARLSR